MSFNAGFKCIDCGPIPKAASKTIKKVQYNVCPTCSKVVSAWIRPLNERSGRCSNCAGGSFTSAIVKRQLMRCCKVCKQVVNTDNNNEVVRKGDIKHEYNQG